MVETTMSGTRTVFNRGIRTYQTSAGNFRPQTSITLPEKEAIDLLGYTDVIDFQKIAPGSSAKMNEMEAENKRLKEELAKKTPAPEAVKEPAAEPKSKPSKDVTAKKRKK